MKDKQGNELTTKEFMQRWGEGIQKITPFQQTKISLIGVILVFIGVIIGVVTTFIMHTWWLFVILLGSFLLTGMSLIGTIQKYIALKKIDEVLNPKENKLQGGLIMDKRAQMELHPIGLVMAVIAFVIGWIIAGKMEAGIVLKIVSAGAAAVVGFFIANSVANSG